MPKWFLILATITCILVDLYVINWQIQIIGGGAFEAGGTTMMPAIF